MRDIDGTPLGLVHRDVSPHNILVGYDGIVEQIRLGLPRAKAEALGTALGGIISVMLRRTEQYRYTSPAQVWDDLRRLDVWGPKAEGPLSQP